MSGNGLCGNLETVTVQCRSNVGVQDSIVAKNDSERIAVFVWELAQCCFDRAGLGAVLWRELL